jgi:hypothetical protein
VIPLPSASQSSTRQRGSFYRVPPNTLDNGTGKRGPRGASLSSVSTADTRQRGSICRVSLSGHSAQAPSPSPGAVTMIFLCQVPSDTRQSLCREPDKKYSAKNPLTMYSSPSLLCRVSHSTKLLLSVFQALSSASDTRQRSCFR